MEKKMAVRNGTMLNIAQSDAEEVNNRHTIKLLDLFTKRVYFFNK